MYKAIDLRLDRIVAVIFLSPGVAGSEERRARLEQEARAISALNHPSIATLFDLGMVGSDQFLVLEYLPGGTLGAQISRLSKSGQVLPISKILDYGGQIASGLEFAHRRGILHRDIKADNVMLTVMLTADGAVKITDVGLARQKGVPRLTEVGKWMGTLAYMPPEQFKGEEVDERADIYSFGVVLHEMLTGRLPFQGSHEAALLYSILNEAPPPVSSLRPDVPPGLEDLIMTMLEKDVAARPASIDQLRQLATFPTGGRPLSVSA